MGDLKEHQPPMTVEEQVEINVRCRAANYSSEKYEAVDIKTMGFPENWKELLEK